VRLQGSGRFTEAVALYKRVLEKQPHDSRALNNLGASLWQLGDSSGAHDAYTRSMQEGEEQAAATGGSPDPAAYVNMGVLYYEYGKVGSEGMCVCPCWAVVGVLTIFCGYAGNISAALTMYQRAYQLSAPSQANVDNGAGNGVQSVPLFRYLKLHYG
jgi:tetratricopeptide (TPR) repeat protein